MGSEPTPGRVGKPARAPNRRLPTLEIREESSVGLASFGALTTVCRHALGAYSRWLYLSYSGGRGIRLIAVSGSSKGPLLDEPSQSLRRDGAHGRMRFASCPGSVFASKPETPDKAAGVANSPRAVGGGAQAAIR